MAQENPVKIVCKQKRAGGSKIELFGTTYHFKPESEHEDAKHVALVSDAKAIHRFLSIKEGYELLDAEAAIPAKPKLDVGQTIGNEKPRDPNAPKDVIITNSEGESVNLSIMQPAELREMARDVFKIAVHHKWADATVIAKIVEATRGEN